MRNIVKASYTICDRMGNKFVSGTALFFLGVFIFFSFCNGKKSPASDRLARTPEELRVKAYSFIRSGIAKAMKDTGRTRDTDRLFQAEKVKWLYEKNGNQPLWFREENWTKPANTFYQLITQCKLLGLFPEDYHEKELTTIMQRFAADTLASSDRKNPALWGEADLQFTDAFIQMVHDLKLGRLPHDSVTLRNDSLFTADFIQSQFEGLNRAGNMDSLVQSLEPDIKEYRQLKEAIPAFLQHYDDHHYTFVPLPAKDSAQYLKAVQRRLYEEGLIAFTNKKADSLTLAKAIRKYQQKKGLEADGKAGEVTIRTMNMSDREKFIRIAISLDAYKMLPEKMPEKYIWVNIPSFFMKVMDHDSVWFSSRIICGKPLTKTPQLTSAVNAIITYPVWVPPPSIIAKEILPGIKSSPDYLSKRGFRLEDSKGLVVDPATVDWSKYNRSIPFRVVQGSGDENALGIMKFIFDNKYSVYLHDTNQRYLFSRSMRSLSHGCVRVQEWDKLYTYLLTTDSLTGRKRSSMIDSVKTWLQKKEKRTVKLNYKMPVFIRYITCEGKDGFMVFHDDIYGYDNRAREKYFSGK